MSALVAPPQLQIPTRMMLEERRKNSSYRLMLWEEYNVQLAWIWVGGFGMEVKDEETNGFGEKREIFRGQRDKGIAQMRRESASRALYNALVIDSHTWESITPNLDCGNRLPIWKSILTLKKLTSQGVRVWAINSQPWIIDSQSPNLVFSLKISSKT